MTKQKKMSPSIAGKAKAGFAAALMALSAIAGAVPLDNAACNECHDGRKEKIAVLAPEGGKRLLATVSPHKYAQGVHAKMDCIACHKEITDARSPHRKSATPKPDCAGCHDDLMKTEAAALPGMVTVAKNIEAYRNSFHARPNKDDKSRANATCHQCHDSHGFFVPQKDTLKRAEWRLTTPTLCGESCHTEELENFTASVHGFESLKRGNLKSAVCVDCHTSHDIGGTSAPTVKLAITAKCGSCHEENLKTYLATYHGQVARLGYAYTATCFNCHGSHDVLRADDPESRVHPDNRLKTCTECHSGKKELPKATAGFISFGPHANAHDREKYPQMWFASRFMIGLLLFVFAYFWAHSLLWWYREYQDRKAGLGAPRVKVDAAVAGSGVTEKYVRRFAVGWRIGHLVLIVVTMTLVLTGVTVLYADSFWAPYVAKALGGPRIMGIIHRVAAAGFLGVFLVHLAGVTVGILRNWKTFRFFGPDSLVPRWKDFIDAWGMFKWFFKKGPRPVFDRWTYWEKFDYWAVFWGLLIIGFSGLMLAFPHVTASLLPGWVFNVATLVHGEEAFLCAVFLFTVHFYNNHFRPDKWPPPDVVMFTGTQSLEEFRREHTLQYRRLVETGQLERYLVDAPSSPMTLGSRILGLAFITIGLTLLLLVGIGYFGGG